MRKTRRTLTAATPGLVLAGLGLAQTAHAAVPPARVWGSVDWDDLIARFAIAGALVFLCNLVCSMLNQSFSDDERVVAHAPRHNLRSMLRRLHP